MIPVSFSDSGWMLDVLSEPVNRYRLSDRAITYCNQAWADLYQVDRSLAVGRRLDDFLSSDELIGLHAQLELIGPDNPVVVDSVARVDSGVQQRWLQWVDHYVVTDEGPEVFSIGRDVTDRHLAELALLDSEMRFRTLADTSSDVVWRVRRPGARLDYLSPSVARVIGFEPEYFAEDVSRVLAIAEPDTRRAIEGFLDGAVLPDRIDLRFRHVEGRIVVIETSITVSDGAIQGVGRDVTEIRHLQKTLKTEATTDTLTGVANRRSFDDALEVELQRTAAIGTTLAVVYIDLDSLKSVNDRYGHDVGDLVLQESARRLEESANQSDFVARVGGDEFTIIHEVCEDSVERLVERLGLRLGEPVSISPSVSIPCSASIGTAETTMFGRCAGDLVVAADRAMYRNKQRDRTR